MAIGCTQFSLLQIRRIKVNYNPISSSLEPINFELFIPEPILFEFSLFKIYLICSIILLLVFASM